MDTIATPPGTDPKDTEIARLRKENAQLHDTVASQNRIIASLQTVHEAWQHAVSEIAKLSVAWKNAETNATIDALTQLPNRRLFESRLDDIHRQAQPYEEKRRPAEGEARVTSAPPPTGSTYGVMFIDLDYFKEGINDTLGHAAGDKVLQRVAEVLRERTKRRTDMAARLGGDEFVILVEGATQEDMIRHARGICDALAQVRLSDIIPGAPNDKTLSASIGMFVYDPNLHPGVDPSTVLYLADIGAYGAKGKNPTALAVPGRNNSCSIIVTDNTGTQSKGRACLTTASVAQNPDGTIEISATATVQPGGKPKSEPAPPAEASSPVLSGSGLAAG